jgi:hypothetical protein
MNLNYTIKISNDLRKKIVDQLEKNPNLKMVLDVDKIGYSMEDY